MDSVEDLFKIKIYDDELPRFAKSYELPPSVNKLYILCRPKYGEIEISVTPNNWRMKPYKEIYSCSAGINIKCLCKQNKSDHKMRKCNKIEVSVFNVDTVLQRENYKIIDFKELDDLWLTHDERYNEKYIFYLTIEEKPFKNFP